MEALATGYGLIDRTAVLLDSAALPGATRVNDLTADTAGRVFVASPAFRRLSGEAARPGQLHVVEIPGPLRPPARVALPAPSPRQATRS